MTRWMDDLKGKFVVVRGPPGVYAGVLEDVDDKRVIIKDCFCLWYSSGFASLNQLAMEGVKNVAECKYSIEVPYMYLNDIFQILPCSDIARENLMSVKKWKL